MTITKKQLKINKLFRKGGGVSKSSRPKPVEVFEDLQGEIQQLEEKLREKQDELFQIQRNSYRCKVKSRNEKKSDVFVRPQKIVLTNLVDSLRNSMEVMSMLTGIEVQSFVAGDHCCVVFHMQHNSEQVVKHGLRIEMKGGLNEISASNLPLGFNLAAVMEDFDNVKKPECLGAIRKALVAYYDRLGQFDALKKLLNVEAELFKTLDGSHIQITLCVKNEMDEEDEPEQFNVTLLLDYRVYDIRPKTYAIRDSDYPDNMAEDLREQCAVFKKLPLRKAFKEAFVNGIGHYKLVQQVGVRHANPPQRRKRNRPRQDYNNDDTFRPEDCSEVEEDDDEQI